MADDSQKPPEGTTGKEGREGTDTTPPVAAADKTVSPPPAEPPGGLKGEVSRTDSPGAGVSAAPPAPPRIEPPAPKPANPEAAVTAATSETSSATGQPTPPAVAGKAPTAAPRPTAAAPAAGAPPAAKPPAAAGAKPEAHAAKPAPPAGPPDPPPPAGTTVPAFITALQGAIADSVSHVSYWVGDWTVVVPVAKLIDVARYLRDDRDAAFDMCSDVTATDWPVRPERFDVIYCLYSTRHRHRVRLKVKAAEHDPVPSATAVWPAANWLEREVYDMFGVNFTGHPDRRRILMPEDWQGFPQRKDYPLEGPGELLMENPLDWLKLRQAKEEADIE
jgi:NADH-quinone oxidoreductase subunit C